MGWILPVSLLLFASAVALWPLAAVVRRPSSAPRLVVEAFVVTVAVIARDDPSGALGDIATNAHVKYDPFGRRPTPS
jgi:hypothetical protein